MKVNLPNFLNEISRGDGEQCTTDARTNGNHSKSKSFPFLEPMSDYAEERTEDDAGTNLK